MPTRRFFADAFVIVFALGVCWNAAESVSDDSAIQSSLLKQRLPNALDTSELDILVGDVLPLAQPTGPRIGDGIRRGGGTDSESVVYRGASSAQNLAFRFDQTGLEISHGVRAARPGLRMRLVAYGYDGHLRPVPPLMERSATESRVEYRYGSPITDTVILREWYVKEPRGLEQGFTLATAPPRDDRLASATKGRAPRYLMLELATGGDWKPEVAADGRSLLFKNRNGASVLRYGKLYSFDATGRALPSTMTVQNASVILAVDDRGASYPVTVDPLFQEEATLTPSQNTDQDQYFGFATAIADTTVIVGAPRFDSGDGTRGRAHVCNLDSGRWLCATMLSQPSSSAFGRPLAIDGERLAIGDTVSQSVHVYHRTAGGWQHEQAIAVGGQMGSWSSLAISGNSLVVGVIGADKALVYTRDESDDPPWSLEAELTGGSGQFGWSVDMDGDTVVVGDNTGGAAYVFSRDGGEWSAPTRLDNPDSGGEFGFSVAVSGNTAVVGAHQADADAGKVHVFTRTGAEGDWLYETTLPRPSGLSANAQLGFSVAIEGARIVVGAPLQHGDRGAVYVYGRTCTGWRLSEAYLASATGNLGHSVAFSGQRFVGGAPHHGTPFGRGAAFLYRRSSENQPPEARCRGGVITVPADLPVFGDDDCKAEAVPASAIDDGSCDPNGDVIDLSVSEGPFERNGPHDVTLTVEDSSGVTDSCIAKVTVVDLTPPTAAIESVQAECVIKDPPGPGAAINLESTATDNCSSPNVRCTRQVGGQDIEVTSGSVLPLGLHTISCTAKDEAGNESSYTFDAAVKDTAAPQVLAALDQWCKAPTTKDFGVGFWSQKPRLLARVTSSCSDRCDPEPDNEIRLNNVVVADGEWAELTLANNYRWRSLFERPDVQQWWGTVPICPPGVLRQPDLTSLTLMGPRLRLKAACEDSSGNLSQIRIVPCLSGLNC